MNNKHIAILFVIAILVPSSFAIPAMSGSLSPVKADVKKVAPSKGYADTIGFNYKVKGPRDVSSGTTEGRRTDDKKLAANVETPPLKLNAGVKKFEQTPIKNVPDSLTGNSDTGKSRYAADDNGYAGGSNDMKTTPKPGSDKGLQVTPKKARATAQRNSITGLIGARLIAQSTK